MESEQELANGKLIVDRPSEGVARITINNAAKSNALDPDVLAGLVEILTTLDARAVVITGRGSTFSAGYDIGSLDIRDVETKAPELIAHPFESALTALANYQYPTIAAINGAAIGGGLELALHCDFRIAQRDAWFTMPPVKIGLIYSHTGVAKFIELIGAARTRELFLRAERVDTAKALQWGMVNEVVADSELEHFGITYAKGLANAAPLAVRGNKRLIDSLLNIAEIDLELEEKLIALRMRSFTSNDFREGVAAFQQKRIPKWTGD